MDAYILTTLQAKKKPMTFGVKFPFKKDENYISKIADAVNAVRVIDHAVIIIHIINHIDPETVTSQLEKLILDLSVEENEFEITFMEITSKDWRMDITLNEEKA